MADEKVVVDGEVYDQDKETKGTFRFAAPDGDDSAVPSLYVRKACLGALKPQQVRVTVTIVQ